MKIPKLFQKPKKLQVAARALPRREAEEYEEPNMRLSSALIVVVLLHLVAVGGIYAFSSIKAHQTSSEVSPDPAVQPATVQSAESKPEPVAASAAAANKTQTPLKATPDHKLADPAVKPAPRDSGQTYTVLKGENPVTIAKRLGVSYDELLKLNKIDDPKKLQIGQKLHLPPKIRSN